MLLFRISSSSVSSRALHQLSSSSLASDWPQYVLHPSDETPVIMRAESDWLRPRPINTAPPCEESSPADRPLRQHTSQSDHHEERLKLNMHLKSLTFIKLRCFVQYFLEEKCIMSGRVLDRSELSDALHCFISHEGHFTRSSGRQHG